MPITTEAIFANLIMTERRETQRHRTLKTGTIIFNNGGGVSCTVCNISPAGACLVVTNQLEIPDEFTLLVESDKILRRCHIGWRSEKKIGVAFN
jgi:PilZ domain